MPPYSPAATTPTTTIAKMVSIKVKAERRDAFLSPVQSFNFISEPELSAFLLPKP
jgi:hypothetical protein